MSKLYYNPELDEVKSPSSIFAVYGLTVNESTANRQGWFPYTVDRELTPQASELFEIVAIVKSGKGYIGRTAIKQETVDTLLKLLRNEIQNKFGEFVADIQYYVRKDLSDWDENTAYQVDDYVLLPSDIDPELINVWRCTQANTGERPDYDIDEWTTTTF